MLAEEEGGCGMQNETRGLRRREEKQRSEEAASAGYEDKRGFFRAGAVAYSCKFNEVDLRRPRQSPPNIVIDTAPFVA